MRNSVSVCMCVFQEQRRVQLPATAEAASESLSEQHPESENWDLYCWRNLTSGHRRSQVKQLHSQFLSFSYFFDVQLTHTGLTHCAPVCGLPSRPPTQPNHDISGDFGCSTFFGITVLACNDMTYAQKLNKHISLNNSHYYNAYDHFLNSHYSR